MFWFYRGAFSRHGEVCTFVECKILSLPFVYLGIPIGANPRLVDTWKPIVHKFARKLLSWKHKVLSMVGRVCLINFILSSFPLFFLSFF